MKIKSITITLFFVLLILNTFFSYHVIAQDAVPTRCGDIKNGEVTRVAGTVVLDRYELSIRQNGTILDITTEPDFGSLDTTFDIRDANGTQLFFVDTRGLGVIDTTTTAPLQAGVYTIQVGSHSNATVGTFTLYIGCLMPNGRVVEPGDPEFGFPGLPDLSFRGITQGVWADTIEGVIPPPGTEVLGYNFQANEGTLLNLNFTHISGELHLVIMMISSDNEVVFTSTLSPSQSLDTTLTIPTTDTYTLAISRFDLMLIAPTEDTIFHIQIG